jgi:hypothetical protein
MSFCTALQCFVLDSDFIAYCACYIGVWWHCCDGSLLETSKSLVRMRDVGQFVVVPSLSCLSHSLDPKCAPMFVASFWATSSDRLLASGFLCRRSPQALSVLHQRPDRVKRLLEEWARCGTERHHPFFASPSRVDDGTVPDRRGIDAYDPARVRSNHDRS